MKKFWVKDNTLLALRGIYNIVGYGYGASASDQLLRGRGDPGGSAAEEAADSPDAAAGPNTV